MRPYLCELGGIASNLKVLLRYPQQRLCFAQLDIVSREFGTGRQQDRVPIFVRSIARRTRLRHRVDRRPRYRVPRMRRSPPDRGCRPANPWSPATAPRQAAYTRSGLRLGFGRADPEQPQNAVRTSALAVVRRGAVERGIFRRARHALFGPALPKTCRRRGHVEVRIGELLFERVQRGVVKQCPPIRIESGFDGLARCLRSLGTIKDLRRRGSCGGSKSGPTVSPLSQGTPGSPACNALKEMSFAFILHLPLRPARRRADRRPLPFPQKAPRSTRRPPPDLGRS